MRLRGAEKVKTHMYGGSQHATAGVGPRTRPRCLCACAQLGNFCPLLQNGSKKRGKDSCNKHGQFWLKSWERTLKQNAHRRLSLFLASHCRLGSTGRSACRTGRLWAHSGLQPCMVRSQLTEVESCWDVPQLAPALGMLQPCAARHVGPGLLPFSHPESSAWRPEMGVFLDPRGAGSLRGQGPMDGASLV